MRNYEMLNRIYKAYNGEDVTIQEMFMNAKSYTDTVLRCYSYHLDEGDKYKYFAIFCSWVAASDGEPSRKEHEFFVRFSGINISYDAFRDTGIKAINNIKTCIELRDLNINKFRSGTTYNIIALCMCGCDGPLNDKEIQFLNNYIRHPDYNPL